MTRARSARKKAVGSLASSGTTVANPDARDGGRGGDCCVVAGVAGRRIVCARTPATILVNGQFDKARRELEQVLAQMPRDAPAQRDAARAAAAAGQFDYAVAALERAHHFEHHTRDPEIHYLRGEALYVLGRDDEARREHRIAELEIGKTPTDKMEKMWLARIYARRGYVVLADRLYESMLPAPPATDAEVALNQADAHLINEDWTGGAVVLRRLPRGRAEERARPRDAGVGARGGRRSRRRARGAAASPTICRRPPTTATTAGPWSAPRASRPRAIEYKRALAEEGAKTDATLAASYEPHVVSHHARAGRGRVVPLRSAGVGVARAGGRGDAVLEAACPERARLARLVERLAREPGHRLQRARRRAAR